MPKPYHGGKRSPSKVPGGGLAKPSYSGADRARSSSMAAMSKGAAPFRGSATGGGAKAGNGPKNKKPGQGSMGAGAARGHDSYPTRGTGARQKAGSPGATLRGSGERGTRINRPY